MMYDPNVFTLNLEQILSGKPYDAAIGVLEVTIRSARGITGQKIGGGTPDPYVSLTIGSRAELAKTKYKNNTYVTSHVFGVPYSMDFFLQLQSDMDGNQIPALHQSSRQS